MFSFGFLGFSPNRANGAGFFIAEKYICGLVLRNQKDGLSLCINSSKAKAMKLYIREEGDMSVGIFPAVWQVDCPFELDEQDKETLDWFKGEILKLFLEFQETKITAYYEHETSADL